MNNKPGDVRIVRVDAHNVAVQQYVQPALPPKSKKNPNPVQREAEWRDVGYYGHRLDFAAEHALFKAVPEGERITQDTIRAAVAQIVKSTKDVTR